MTSHIPEREPNRPWLPEWYALRAMYLAQGLYYCPEQYIKMDLQANMDLLRDRLWLICWDLGIPNNKTDEQIPKHKFGWAAMPNGLMYENIRQPQYAVQAFAA